MDVRLYTSLSGRLPKFNKEITQGLAYTYLRPDPTMEYIDTIIRSICECYPGGLEFLGSRRCTPIEEYRVSIQRKLRGKGIFDIAKSDLYMVRYDMQFQGQPCKPQYLYLPFARPAGYMYLSDKKLGIHPILADKLFSVTGEEIFIQMPRAKLKFYRELQAINKDGFRISKYLTWSWIHNLGGRIKVGSNRTSLIRANRMKSIAMHYLFCKYGLTGTFSKYLGFEPVVMELKEYRECKDKYPVDDWVVYQSLREEPHEYVAGSYSTHSCKTVILAPREKVTTLTDAFVAGFYYVADRIPSMMDATQIDDLEQWQTMMGFILFGDFTNRGKAIINVQEHISSIDGYVDFQVKSNIDAVIKDTPSTQEHLNDIVDIYDLLAYLQDMQTEILIRGSYRPGNLYEKQFMVLRYVLSNLNASLFELLFKLTSPRNEIRDVNDVNRLLDRHFRVRSIFALNSSQHGQRHAEVNSISSPSDNMFFKITSIMTHQSGAGSDARGNEVNIYDPSNHLDSSFCEVAGYNISPKTAPIGNSRINPWVNLHPDGSICRKEEFRELIDSVQKEIR